MNGADSRYELEREANVARGRLLETIDALERRRHEIFDWRFQVRTHSTDIALTAGALLFGIAITAGAAKLHSTRSRESLRRARWRAMKRSWEHPERVAPRRRPFGVFVQALLVAVAALATAELGLRPMRARRERPRLPASLGN
jgi:hypothetical protein